MPPYSNDWFQGVCPICARKKHVCDFPAFGILCADCYFAKGREMWSFTRRSKGNRVARLSYGTVRRLGSVSRFVCDGFLDVGRFITGASKRLTKPSQASVQPSQQGPPALPRDAIRSVVIEELARMRVAEGRIAQPELEERLRLMALAIGALQERIDEIGPRGSIISEATMWKEVGTLEAAESLTNDERTLLVNVFRQNIAIQKPELVTAGGFSGAADRR